jgi:enoyl-CoA hydratase/carnithine racemase
VLTGNGPASCAGFDLKEIPEGSQRGQHFRPPMNRPTRSLFEVVTETPVPIVAALNGAAIAGGVGGRGVGHPSGSLWTPHRNGLPTIDRLL